MSFATGALSDPGKVQGGEVYGDANAIVSFEAFENGLVVGRYAKYDNSQIENMDGSVTPTIAGVVRRNPANPVEDGATIDNTLWEKVDIVMGGFVTVDVVTGQTPAPFGAVFASNAGDANDGKAITSAGIATGDIFIEEVTTDVWLVQRKVG